MALRYKASQFTQEYFNDIPVRDESADFIDKKGSFWSAGVLDALLHHVGGELVLGQRQHLSANSCNDF